MFDQLTFQRVAGNEQRRIRMLALSTCGFCRKGQEFLESRGLAYEYIHLDTVDPELKAAAKAEFKQRFGVSLSYPALVIDDETQIVGYVRRQWEELLGLEHQEDA